MAGVGESTMGCRPWWASLRGCPRAWWHAKPNGCGCSPSPVLLCGSGGDPGTGPDVFPDYLGFCCHLLAEQQEGPAGLGGARFLRGSCALRRKRLCSGDGAGAGLWHRGSWGFAGFQQQGGSVPEGQVASAGVQKGTRASGPASPGKCISWDTNISSAASSCALIGWGHRLPPNDKYALEMRGRFCYTHAVSAVSACWGQGCSCLLRACLRAAPSRWALRTQLPAPSSGLRDKERPSHVDGHQI